MTFASAVVLSSIPTGRRVLRDLRPSNPITRELPTMTTEYDGNHALGIGYFERIEGRSVGRPAAIFHKIPAGYPLTPKDPEVKLTPDEMAARISWRKECRA